MEKITGKEIKIIDVPIEEIDNKYKELIWNVLWNDV